MSIRLNSEVLLHSRHTDIAHPITQSMSLRVLTRLQRAPKSGTLTCQLTTIGPIASAGAMSAGTFSSNVASHTRSPTMSRTEVAHIGVHV